VGWEAAISLSGLTIILRYSPVLPKAGLFFLIQISEKRAGKT
jgi:hypothetical protein